MIRSTTLLLAFAFFFSFQAIGQKYVGDEKDIQAILKNVENFSQSYMNGDVEGIVNAYTKDGKIMPNNTNIIEGKEGLTKYWTMPEGFKVKFHKVTPLEIFISDDRADDFGYYEGTTLRPDGTESSWRGKYIIVWKKIEGQWKIYLDIWNSIAIPQE